MSVSITILGSGSSGNCACIDTGETRILVDAGFSARQIRQRLAAIGRVPENLNGILITHEHSDHVAGLAVLAGKLGIPVYCNGPTRDAIVWQLRNAGKSVALNWRIFTTGATVDIGDLSVDTFSIPHDAQDPVGYLVRTARGNMGILTDLGHATRLALERVRKAHVLMLETNHDVKMLQECPHRPWSLKQRILGRHGHLSNESAAEAIEMIMTGDMRHLYLGHLSRECNSPKLALRVITKCLGKIGAAHCVAELTTQDTPCPTLVL